MNLELEVMAEIAQPLDRWCDLCGMKLAVAVNPDGIAACSDCAAEVIEAERKVAADMALAARLVAKPPTKKADAAGKAKARAKRRAKRKRTKR